MRDIMLHKSSSECINFKENYSKISFIHKNVLHQCTQSIRITKHHMIDLTKHDENDEQQMRRYESEPKWLHLIVEIDRNIIHSQNL